MHDNDAKLVIRGRAETETETLSNNQNWFLFDWDAKNTGIPATTLRKKALRIFLSLFSCPGQLNR